MGSNKMGLKPTFCKCRFFCSFDREAMCFCCSVCACYAPFCCAFFVAWQVLNILESPLSVLEPSPCCPRKRLPCPPSQKLPLPFPSFHKTQGGIKTDEFQNRTFRGLSKLGILVHQQFRYTFGWFFGSQEGIKTDGFPNGKFWAFFKLAILVHQASKFGTHWVFLKILPHPT